MSEKNSRKLFAQITRADIHNVGIEFLNSAVSKTFSRAKTSGGIEVNRDRLQTFKVVDGEIIIVDFEPGIPRRVEGGTKIIYLKAQSSEIAVTWARFDEFQKAQSEAERFQAQA